MLSMLNLRDQLFHQSSRAKELSTLRRLLKRQPRGSRVSAEELHLALELRELRLALTAALPLRSACTSCADHSPLPHGHWSGGYCCGAPTRDLFSDDEIASLRIAGTRPRNLKAPRGVHAGCVFRGPQGCSLSPAHRPNICVRHICWDLARSLKAQGALTRVDDLGQQIKTRFENFVRLRHDRLEQEFFGRLDWSASKIMFNDFWGRLRDLDPPE